MDNWKAADLSTIRHPRPLHELLTKAGTEDAIIFQMQAPLPLALCTLAVVALSACSNGAAGSASTDKIAAADQGGATRAAAPSTSAPGSMKRPVITLPSDVKNVFAGWKTRDTTKDALLADVENRINATDAAIIAANPDSEALGFYYKGEALAGASEWVKGYVKDGKSITGSVRFFNPELKLVDKDTAAFAYCSDESKAFDKDRKTNKAEKTTVTKTAYVAYNTRVEKNEQGVWQTTSLLSQRGNAKCTP
ncbi:hypothetical protein ACH4ND_19000 [Streptomyces sp. NPDC017179]|uniref:hypothetical protein n=1 Tax=Streptomyces sp. NPDC017179 TaxID=3364979 RepID=UPI0037B4F0DD